MSERPRITPEEQARFEEKLRGMTDDELREALENEKRLLEINKQSQAYPLLLDTVRTIESEIVGREKNYTAAAEYLGRLL